jgi:hypothetical protein
MSLFSHLTVIFSHLTVIFSHLTVIFSYLTPESLTQQGFQTPKKRKKKKEKRKAVFSRKTALCPR